MELIGKFYRIKTWKNIFSYFWIW